MHRPLSGAGQVVDDSAARVMSGGHAIVEALIANDVDTVFGIPGAQMYSLFDGLHARRDRVRTVGARHEQGCGYGAFGYAQSTGRPGVCAVVPGVGMLNASAALLTAWSCNTPVLCITGEIPSAFMGKRRGHLHEMRDQLGTIRQLVKWAERIERPADVPAIIDEAFRQMLSGRPGPVAVEMPWDIMESAEPVRLLGPASIPVAPPPSPDAVEAAARLIAGGRKPMLFVGSGARGAVAEVRELAAYLDAPVVSLRGGRGIVSEDERLGVSAYAAKLMWPETDVAIGIGTRMELPFTRWGGQFMRLIDAPDAPPHVVRIDIDPAEMRRLRPHAAVVGDAKVATRQLLDALRRTARTPAVRTVRPEQAKQDAQAELATSLAPYPQYLAVVRAALPDNGIIVDEVSQIGFAVQTCYPVRAPGTLVTAGFQGTLGFGFPTALGVKVGNPDVPVVSLTGDGGFMFGANELITAAQEGIALITLVFNNRAYGNVKRDQQRMYGGRIMGAELVNPDFVALAQACGVEGRRVASPDELAVVLKELIALDRPALVDVCIDVESTHAPLQFAM